MPVDDIQLEAEASMSDAVDFLKSELRGIRTGRASTALVEHIRVQYYGTPTELRQMAQISTPEGNLIVIKPFDASVLKEIEKAIHASDIGITPSSDGRVIRLNVPPLSGERRRQLAQHVRQLGEQAKVSIRNARRDANKQIDQEQKGGDIPEDNAETAKEEIQNLTKKYETEVDETAAAKIKEIEEI
ncbi:MAG: ribosome recycling factor [Phycisphaerae bacterium]|nr:ribosome recycling factor [Phycisphaerae bacterium]